MRLSRQLRSGPGTGHAGFIAIGSLILLLGGCRGEDPETGAAFRGNFPAGGARSPIRIGAAETRDPDAAIGRIVAARFSGSGERVVVLDYAPPYVKIFRPDGMLERAFLGRGGGPLEMRDPAALAVAGDSLILVADGSRRVAVFGMDGQLRGETRTNFPVLAAAAGCDDEWVVYGPDFQGGRTPSWLHRLRIGRGTRQTEALEFRDALGGGVIGNGLPYGIARSGDTIRVWHVLGAAPAVLGWSCGQARPDAWAVRPLAQRTSAEGKGDAVRMGVGPGQRTLAGMAAVAGGVVLAAQVVPPPGESATTELTLVTADSERTVTVTGTYTLRDGHPQLGVLVSTSDPVPRLFAITRDELLRLFRPG
jgi:hypothetical protein